MVLWGWMYIMFLWRNEGSLTREEIGRNDNLVLIGSFTMNNLVTLPCLGAGPTIYGILRINPCKPKQCHSEHNSAANI
jgi:hypothetical protein